MALQLCVIGFNTDFDYEENLHYLVFPLDLYDNSSHFTRSIRKEEYSYFAELTWADKIAGVNAKVWELFSNRKVSKGICYSI